MSSLFIELFDNFEDNFVFQVDVPEHVSVVLLGVKLWETEVLFLDYDKWYTLVKFVISGFYSISLKFLH